MLHVKHKLIKLQPIALRLIGVKLVICNRNPSWQVITDCCINQKPRPVNRVAFNRKVCVLGSWYCGISDPSVVILIIA